MKWDTLLWECKTTKQTEICKIFKIKVWFLVPHWFVCELVLFLYFSYFIYFIMTSIILFWNQYFFLLSNGFLALIRCNMNTLKECATVQVPVYSVRCLWVEFWSLTFCYCSVILSLLFYYQCINSLICCVLMKAFKKWSYPELWTWLWSL